MANGDSSGTAGGLHKGELLALAEQYVCPDRVRFLRSAGIDLMIGRREGYRLWDLDGRELIDVHLNGGVYNLGHRNPRLVAALVAGVQEFDIGNHHFPSSQRALVARDLVEATDGMKYAVFASGGGEAVDLAIKTARRFTGRTRIVSARDAYHGHTGLALAAGDEAAAEAFHSTSPAVTRVPFNDAAAIDRTLAHGDVAAVILETVPATAGFVHPPPATSRRSVLRVIATGPYSSPTRCRPAWDDRAVCGRSTTKGSPPTSW